MTEKFSVIIPARFQSTRLPGKPLIDINGKTLIQHVYDAACQSEADSVIIATDDERVDDVARSFGAEVVMTSPEHLSGTERLAETVTLKEYPDDGLVVNVQGDEFGLEPEHINIVASSLTKHTSAQVSTLCTNLQTEDEMNDPNIVKVVCDRTGKALYFSRSCIPSVKRNQAGFQFIRRHIGLYAYRCDFLRSFPGLGTCDLEEIEQLEQLRALYNGYQIQVEYVPQVKGMGIDTDDDLERARQK